MLLSLSSVKTELNLAAGTNLRTTTFPFCGALLNVTQGGRALCSLILLQHVPCATLLILVGGRRRQEGLCDIVAVSGNPPARTVTSRLRDGPAEYCSLFSTLELVP